MMAHPPLVTRLLLKLEVLKLTSQKSDSPSTYGINLKHLNLNFKVMLKSYPVTYLFQYLLMYRISTELNGFAASFPKLTNTSIPIVVSRNF